MNTLECQASVAPEALSSGATFMRPAPDDIVLHKLISHLRGTTSQAAPSGPATRYIGCMRADPPFIAA
jgi:hypothetical protein